MSELPGIVDASLVAEDLGLPRAWVIAHSGKVRPRIPDLKLGKHLRYRRADIEEFVCVNTRNRIKAEQ